MVNGVAKPCVLETYKLERRPIAQGLIAFDHRLSRLFSGRPAKDTADEAGISMSELKSVFTKGAMFASGFSVGYGPSILVAKPASSKRQWDDTQRPCAGYADENTC